MVDSKRTKNIRKVFNKQRSGKEKQEKLRLK